MNAVDIILILLIAFAVVMAVRSIINNKKKGKGCCGMSCESCGACREYGSDSIRQETKGEIRRK